MRPIELDERLKTIASLVRQGSRVADIGCDHGYLICALTESGHIPGGVACDLRAGPLSHAKKEVEKRNLSDKIECRLCDGLSLVSENEADDIVIAGMGGELIADILSACEWENKAEKSFILQPMSRAPLLRRWLYANGYAIKDEVACTSADRPYTVMQVFYTGEKTELGEYDLFTYVGGLGKSGCAASKEYIRRAAFALVKRENGVLGSNPAEAMRLRSLSNKMLSMIEGW